MAVAEAEVVADQNSARVQGLAKNAAGKFRGLEQGNLAGKWQNEHLLDAFLQHGCRALLGGGEQERHALGSDDAGRVRMEGQRGGFPAAFARHLDDAAQNAPMAGVDTVEVADSQHARAEPPGRLFNAPEDHRAPPTAISRPS